MISMDMGIETAVNGGLPLPASGEPAVPGAVASFGRRLRVERAPANGLPSFRAALRAAATNDSAAAAASRPAPPTPDSVVACEGETASVEEMLDSDARRAKVESSEPGGEVPAADGGELIGMPRSGRLQAARAGDVSAACAVEALGNPADAGPFDAAGTQGFSELADLVNRLQHAWSRNSADSAAEIRRVADRIVPHRVALDRGSAPPSSEVMADLLSQLREALSAAAGELTISAQSGSDAPALKETSAAPAPAQTGQAAGERPPIEVADLLSAARRLLAQLRPAPGAVPDGAASTAVGAEAAETPPPTTVALGVSGGVADATGGYGFVRRAAQPAEDALNGAATERSRHTVTESERGAAAEARQESSAESGVFGKSPDPSLHAEMTASPASTAEGEALPDTWAAAARDPQKSPAVEGGLEKAAENTSVLRDKETLAGTGRAGLFDQMVQRAAVLLRNDQGEIQIDLKPDFLGRVRMQIQTENQQVTVRILTELAGVRDLIETGLNQLKSELQSQGLQVERLEVAVADDQRQRGWPQTNRAPARFTAAGGEVSAMERSETEDRAASPYYRTRSNGAAGIDMFV